MKTATTWFEQYGESHQNKTNKAIHWICIPVIVLSTLGLFAALPHPFGATPWLSWATVAVAGALVFYASLSWTIFAGMALWAGTCLALIGAATAAALPVGALSFGVFFAAWVAQFIGHKIEGAKPSFIEDLQFLLVGPAWLLQFVYRRVGIPVETRRPLA